MATYYWLGSVSTDVTNPVNWTTINPNSFFGIPGNTASLPRAIVPPGGGDNVVFDKFGITGTTFTYPIFPPAGSMVVYGGSTSAYLNYVQINGQYNKGIGTGTTLSGSYLGIYARTIDLKRDSTFTDGTGYTFCYKFDLLESTVPGASLALLQLSLLSNSEDLSWHNTDSAAKVVVKGKGHITGRSDYANTAGEISFGTTFSGKIGPFSNPRGGERFVLHSGITLSANHPMHFSGARNYLWIKEGFKTAPYGEIRMDGSSTKDAGNGVYRHQTIIFEPRSYTGISGGITADAATTTTVDVMMYNSSWYADPYLMTQSITVNHPVDFKTLELHSGRLGFGSPNATTRVFQGIVSTNAAVIISYPDIVTFFAPGGYSAEYTGMTVVDSAWPPEITPRPFPFLFRSTGTYYNYKFVLGGDDNYWKKQWAQ